MKKLTHIVSAAAMALLAVCAATSAFSAEPDQAVVRTVYGTEVTQAIAKSVGLLERISEGDCFAVVQSVNGAWALALLPAGMNPGKLDLIELPQTGQAQPSSTDHVKLVHLLMPAHRTDPFATQLAGSQL